MRLVLAGILVVASAACGHGSDAPPVTRKESPPPFVWVEVRSALVSPRNADGAPWDFCAPCGAADALSFTRYRDAAGAAASQPAASWGNIAREIAAEIGRHAGQHFARPDVRGWAEVARDGFTFGERQTLQHGGADDFAAVFVAPAAFRRVQTHASLRLQVYLEDKDVSTHDPIDTVVLTADMLEAARVAGRGVPVPVPVAQQGTGQVFFVSVAVGPDA